MTEIKPVYQVKPRFDWYEVGKDAFDDEVSKGVLEVRILYPAAAYEALQKENAELKEDLQFVERWANHHGTKPNVTAQEALSCIQHYPSIAAITKSYKDGIIPTTRNPYAEIESLRKQVEEARSWVEILSESFDFSIFPTLKNEIDCFVAASKNGE